MLNFLPPTKTRKTRLFSVDELYVYFRYVVPWRTSRVDRGAILIQVCVSSEPQVSLHPQLLLSIQLWQHCGRVIVRRRAQQQSPWQSNGPFHPQCSLSPYAGTALLYYRSVPVAMVLRVNEDRFLAGPACCRFHRLTSRNACFFQASRPAGQPSLSKMRLFVCRHGERMDVVFGKHWITQCFDSKG